MLSIRSCCLSAYRDHVGFEAELYGNIFGQRQHQFRLLRVQEGRSRGLHSNPHDSKYFVLECDRPALDILREVNGTQPLLSEPLPNRNQFSIEEEYAQACLPAYDELVSNVASAVVNRQKNSDVAIADDLSNRSSS